MTTLDLQTQYLALQNAAKDCVDGHKFNKIEDLLKHLKGHFSSGRDFKTYHQELAKIALLPDENVSQYGARVQHLVRGARAA